ncbi:hypothetical protein HME9304_03180 [Flagellimonas maritima]|uniref:Uncharacterized protein n=1 Tax=Flagellimonas maritima TaxID=1383885 RepID=A0A2Z4LXQ2_9FLAO|nr:hypothetical protein [Allomuricauda aurantiaca]AWX46148.1 hypothetical protein HME9304_03180 [Allomuricauda aurantiaca]
MRKYFFITSKLIFTILFINNIEAQSDIKKDDLYETFDKIVGVEVSGLYNGIQYNNEYIVLDEKHQFLETDEFLEGFIGYDGQDYYGTYMKYDLFYDEIIVRPQNSSSGLAFKIIKSLVDEFSLNSKRFINIKALNSKTNEPFGYCELLSETEFFNLYKKYKKKPAKKARSGKIFYEFNQSSTYYLKYGNEYNPVTTRNDLISIFPDYKSVIKDYYKGYRQLLKSDQDTFIKLLIARLNELEQLKTA